MSNSEKYLKVFVDTLEIRSEEAEGLKYNSIANWDSVGHMNLVAALEDAFDIMMDTDDIIDFSSFEKGKEILASNYSIEF
ncbi:acyl carrier protein [Roseburia sp. 1XD42-69]|uniref:acyl carrier protein n=1 Tax=Roseburia sp. 1XD42-69 TaxID=2320088 RepID=UPI000EA194B0|nr:acyl carrier protein [Roseburia sp. 1XD42-69]RKJ68105.1 acyl carrier protein [Roseburia sp. 1XD42-69]